MGVRGGGPKRRKGVSRGNRLFCRTGGNATIRVSWGLEKTCRKKTMLNGGKIEARKGKGGVGG